MDDHLNPCQFCHFDLVVFEPIRTTPRIVKYAVVCPHCGCHGPLKETIEEAVTAWNTCVFPRWLREKIEKLQIDGVGTTYAFGWRNAIRKVLSLIPEDKLDSEISSFDLYCTGMINGWKTKMGLPQIYENGSPRPPETDAAFPIGKRLRVIIEGDADELEAFKKGLDAGLIAEIWIAESGKFA